MSLIDCLEEISTAKVEVIYKNQIISVIANLDSKVKDFITMITGNPNAKLFDLKFEDEWSLQHSRTLRSEGVTHNIRLILLDEPPVP